MRKYIASIVQVVGAITLTVSATMISPIFGISLAGILLLLFGIALERRAN